MILCLYDPSLLPPAEQAVAPVPVGQVPPDTWQDTAQAKAARTSSSRTELGWSVLSHPAAHRVQLQVL